MPYERKADLPDNVHNNLPDHAQDIYLKSFNAAWDRYADPDLRRGDAGREEVSHKVAWAAVEKTYRKDEKGRWVSKR